MKVLFINPPRSPYNGILEHASPEAAFFIHKKLVGPPLGLLTVATAIEKEHDIAFFDMKGEYDLDPKSPGLTKLTENLIAKHQPDVVASTFIASEFDYGVEIFETAKKLNQDIITIAGGLHTSLAVHDFNLPQVDYILPGQSAHTFRDLINTLNQKGTVEKIPGIIINTHNQFTATREKANPEDAAGKDFILPNRSYIERWKQTYKVGNHPHPITYMFSSLGCPYKCTFCSIWCQYNGRYQKRSVESMIAEIKLLEEYQVIRFADANTVVDIKFIDHLFDRILEEKIDKEWVMDIRADTAVRHPRLIEKLAKGGLKVVICGFESFREKELQRYNKSSEANLIHEAIRIFHDNGIMLRGNYVIPPDYTHNDFKAIAEYTDSHRVAYAGYTILTPMPGTPYYEQTKSNIIDHDLRKYNFFNSVFNTTLPKTEFYREVSKLWLIKKGKDVI